MILEVAHLDVRTGQEEAFERAFSEAKDIVASMPGFLGLQLQRCLERPARYVLLVEWQTLSTIRSPSGHRRNTKPGRRSCITSTSLFPQSNITRACSSRYRRRRNPDQLSPADISPSPSKAPWSRSMTRR